MSSTMYLGQAPQPGSKEHVDLISLPLLYLPDGAHSMDLPWDHPHRASPAAAGGSGGAAAGGFFSLDQIYLPSIQAAAVPQVTQLTAHYLRKALVCPATNSQYYEPLARLQQTLGLPTLPDFRDTLLAHNVMAASAAGHLAPPAGQEAAGAAHAPAGGSRGSSRYPTAEQQGGFMSMLCHLEGLLEQEVRRQLELHSAGGSVEADGTGDVVAADSGGGSAGADGDDVDGLLVSPPLAELLEPSSRLSLLQGSLWRWHLGRCKQPPQALAALCEGISLGDIECACQQWLAAQCPACGAASRIEGGRYSAPAGMRCLVPLVDHRRAVLLGPSLELAEALCSDQLAGLLRKEPRFVPPLVRAELVQQCPLLLAALHVPYVEHRSLMTWMHNKWVPGCQGAGCASCDCMCAATAAQCTTTWHASLLMGIPSTWISYVVSMLLYVLVAFAWIRAAHLACRQL
jgi:hypothetical protein